jgi:hypothetical protein
MLAVVGVAVGETFHPLLGTADVGPATTHFQQVSEAYGDAWVGFLFFASVGLTLILHLHKSFTDSPAEEFTDSA